MAIQVSLLPLLMGAAFAAFAVSKSTTYTFTYALVATYSLVLPVFLFYKSYIFPFYLSELRHVPTVPGFPLWGQFFTIITEECGIPQRRWHQEHGPSKFYHSSNM
jgi:hypothetical protein